MIFNLIEFLDCLEVFRFKLLILFYFFLENTLIFSVFKSYEKKGKDLMKIDFFYYSNFVEIKYIVN